MRMEEMPMNPKQKGRMLGRIEDQEKPRTNLQKNSSSYTSLLHVPFLCPAQYRAVKSKTVTTTRPSKELNQPSPQEAARAPSEVQNQHPAALIRLHYWLLSACNQMSPVCCTIEWGRSEWVFGFAAATDCAEPHGDLTGIPPQPDPVEPGSQHGHLSCCRHGKQKSVQVLFVPLWIIVFKYFTRL